jgi:hypothetical protein
MGGNFIAQLLADECLNCVNKKLDKSTMYTDENNEYLKTCFYPIVDRFHTWEVNPKDYDKIRKSKNIILNCTPEFFTKIYNLGRYKNRYRRNENISELPIDGNMVDYHNFQIGISNLFPNKEYFEIDYQELFLDINKEKIQEMLDYICFPIEMTNEIARQIQEYSNENIKIFKKMGYDG